MTCERKARPTLNASLDDDPDGRLRGRFFSLA